MGVRPSGKQNPCPESGEDSEAEGEAFERFDGVVAAIGKSVGQANIECFLCEAFPTNEANVPPPAVRQPRLQIAHLPDAIIVNALRLRAAPKKSVEKSPSHFL